MSGDVFDRIRAACAEVTRRARHVRIDEGRIPALAEALVSEAPPAPDPDPVHHPLGDDASTLAYVVTLDAVNFGSGYFPHMKKRPGLSGYFTVAAHLKQRFEKEGPWSADELAHLTAADCAGIFGQDPAVPEMAELMDLFARALCDLGCFLRAEHGGRFEGIVEAAAGSAGALVGILARMPLFRDVASYPQPEPGAREVRLDVPFYKRAQLTAADLATALGGRGPGRFQDLDRLTLFADNLVPHVLRCEGVLRYAPELARRIDAAESIAAGSDEEVEIRAVAVHAVERLAAATGRAAWQLDHALWNRGQRPESKARPRHRTRTSYY